MSYFGMDYDGCLGSDLFHRKLQSHTLYCMFVSVLPTLYFSYKKRVCPM